MFLFICSDMEVFFSAQPFALDIKGGEYPSPPFALDVKGGEYFGVACYL